MPEEGRGKEGLQERFVRGNVVVHRRPDVFYEREERVEEAIADLEQDRDPSDRGR